ncbi:branched-chain amino acid ABC transporter permease [candidate division KSB1 bacterium]
MFIQIIVNGVIASCIYTLYAIGFSLIYSTVGFFHFAHAAIFTAGAYLTFLFYNWGGLSLHMAVIISLILSSAIGCCMELFIYRPLRKKEASPLSLLIASLGIYIVLQNLISLIFGDYKKSLRSDSVQEGISFFSARITPVQLIIIIIGFILLVVLTIWIKKSKNGKQIRAVSNNPVLSNIVGVDSNKIILTVFALGSVIAGLAGILVSFDVDMTPTMGMNALMMGVVVTIIGGIGSIPGVVLGSFLLGMSQHFSIWILDSQWQETVAFIILLLFLLFRPQGFLGKTIKKVTI